MNTAGLTYSQQVFSKSVSKHLLIQKKEFNPFDLSVPTDLAQHMLDFNTFAKDNFIGEFRDNQASTTVGNIEGKPYDGFIPINCKGGFFVREEYRNDVDPCSHFTKEQTTWKNKQAAQSLVDFCKHYNIDTDTALSEEYEDKLVEWEEDLHEPALLELRCLVTMDKVRVDLAVDYKGGATFDWNLLWEQEFSVNDFMELEFEEFFEGLVNSVNILE
jgi:hypothetical protein